jgi:UDP-N-acetylmuramate--alanine ligase
LSFGDMGAYEPGSEYFLYEADEFDRNFLAFKPYISLITGIDWDHPDIYQTREDYNRAFADFIGQSEWTVLWGDDFKKAGVVAAANILVLDKNEQAIANVRLAGLVNRQNAFLVASGVSELVDKPVEELVELLGGFPGLSRRFEEIKAGLYTDYAHTPPKIAGALQLAHEVAGENVVVVYEGLHNTRQHFIAKELKNLFDSAKQLYIVPSYLAREDKSLKLLSPSDIKSLLSHDTQVRTEPAALDEGLKDKINKHLAEGDLVLCLSAGGGGSLDEWLRQTFGN